MHRARSGRSRRPGRRGGAPTPSVPALKQAKPALPAGRKQLTLNFKVGDFDGFLSRLKAKGATVSRTEDHEYGRFGWVEDLEGNTVEFWQPK